MKAIYLIPIIFLGACVTTRPTAIPIASTANVQQHLEQLDLKLIVAGQMTTNVGQHLQNAREAADKLLKELDAIDQATPKVP